MPKDEQGAGDEVADADETTEAAAEVPAEHFNPPGFLEAAKTIFRPGGRPRAQPATGTDADAKAINLLDRNERIIAWFAGVFQIVLGFVVLERYRNYVEKPSTKKPVISVAKAHSDTLNYHHIAPELFAVNLILGIAIAGSTFTKRRALVGFTILLGGLAMNATGGGIIGLVYLGVGIWLVFRSMRRNPSAQAARAGGTGGGAKGKGKPIAAATVENDPRSPGERARAEAAAKASSARAAQRSAAAAAASKRYTPPRPSRPAPPKAPQPEPEKESRLMSWLRK